MSVCAYNSNACLGLGMKVEESEEKLKPAIAKMFSIMHKSVSEYSQRMLDELKRHNYVTPTNYLELVSGYKSYVYSTYKTHCSLVYYNI